VLLSIPYLRAISEDANGNLKVGLYMERLLLAMSDTESALNLCRNRESSHFTTLRQDIDADCLERHLMALTAEYALTAENAGFARPFKPKPKPSDWAG
jgi:hypothetical protein